MSYKVTISGGTVLEECIEHIAFTVDDLRKSMIITGKVDTDESTVALYQWSLLKGTDSKCYKKVIVRQYQKDLLVREVTFSKAFVIDYSENYSNYSGTGTFTLYVRQLFNKEIKATDEETNEEADEGAYQSNTTSKVTDKIEEKVEDLKEKVAVTESIPKTEKTTMSFTDRIEKQKEIQDNIVENKVKPVVVEAKMTLNGKEYHDVNPTARLDRAEPPGELTGILGPTPNRNTRDMHAEISCMYKALKENNKGGSAVIEVQGQEVCDWCQKDLKKMAQSLELDELVVKDCSGTYKFKGPVDFLNKPQGGKTWKMARL